MGVIGGGSAGVVIVREGSKVLKVLVAIIEHLRYHCDWSHAETVDVECIRLIEGEVAAPCGCE